MLKQTIAASTVALALGLAVPPAAASADVAGLAVGTIGYNAHGADVPGNRNSEYIDVVNAGREPVDVKGLRIEDAWAHANPDRAAATGCNTFTVAVLPGVAPGADGAVMLAPRHAIRVYMGAGTDVLDGRTYKLFKNSDPRCGFNGHVLNNNAPVSGTGPWETVWLVKGAASEAKSYEFYNGYYVR
ncbi:hypothetical protein ACQP2T_28025 [Nonomuraea sp. CA-143628]|uniref:hypothetical protein n=1 Tax=Nonomuraea sp. CA-143628 TaxID=3239997 RepID=UPI003D8CAEB4